MLCVLFYWVIFFLSTPSHKFPNKRTDLKLLYHISVDDHRFPTDCQRSKQNNEIVFSLHPGNARGHIFGGEGGERNTIKTMVSWVKGNGSNRSRCTALLLYLHTCIHWNYTHQHLSYLTFIRSKNHIEIFQENGWFEFDRNNHEKSIKGKLSLLLLRDHPSKTSDLI